MLILPDLVIGLAAAHSATYTSRARSLIERGVAVGGLVVSVGLIIVLTLLYGTWPRRRWITATTAAAVLVLFLATLPPATEPRDPAAAPFPAGPEPTTVALVWPASTTAEAPLFDPSGNLVRTLPVHSAVKVKCQYRGNPPKPWRTDGIEYHVITPRVGHIPELYLTFNGTAVPTPPPGMPDAHQRHRNTDRVSSAIRRSLPIRSVARWPGERYRNDALGRGAGLSG
jgi:hypothetical protein